VQTLDTTQPARPLRLRRLLPRMKLILPNMLKMPNF